MEAEGHELQAVPGIESPSHEPPAAFDLIRLRDGSQICIRPIRPEDKQLLRAGFERLSPESRYRRFFAPVKRLTDGQLAYFTEVDHRNHEALLALTQTGEAVGVARFIRLAARPQTAEVAVTVVDDWHGRGVATELLNRLVDKANAAGIELFTASCLADNHDVIELLEHLGATRFAHPDAGVLELEIELPDQVAPGQALHRALRGAAAGELSFHGPSGSPPKAL